jgi:dTDP-4-amino-4,6-dideoxygalactose transaminase
MVAAFDQPIYVTRPILPDLGLVTEKLEQIWAAQWLTNGGGQHNLLEARLRERLAVPYLALFNNGTNALMAAVDCLGLSGEVITTPFTFVATTHSLAQNGLVPVFCDVDQSTMNIDATRIESLITPRTTAIMPVHVYGMPCDVERIDDVARQHGLKVIYDAAHAFGTEVDGVGIGNFGDVTMYSFHATKTFHTVEGGALAFADPELKQRIERYKNFGICDEETVSMVGFNGKLNELQAAVGLTVLDCLDDELAKRRNIIRLYRDHLNGVDGIELAPLMLGVASNPSYFVIRVDEAAFGCSRDDVYGLLREHNVFARKYFYPLCSEFGPYRRLPSSSADRLPVATRIARQVLALPLYGALEESYVDRICELILSARSGRRRHPAGAAGRQPAVLA